MLFLVDDPLLLLFRIILILLFGPLLVSAAIHFFSPEQPPWWNAEFRSSGQAPKAGEHTDAVVQIYGARAYRWRGIFAVHTWLAIKKQGAARYQRYDVIGWNVVPLTVRNGGADADWYGRAPTLIFDARGERANALIPQIEQAISEYPYGGRGQYVTFPGPNSNSFVAHIVRSVPDLDVALPPHAVGKDYAPGWFSILQTPSNTGWQVSVKGYGGLAIGLVEGIELHFLGQTLGIDFLRPALKFPGLERIGMDRVTKY